MTETVKRYIGSLAAPKDKKQWMLNKHQEYNNRDKGFYQKKVANFFAANKVDYLFKFPVWIPDDNKIYFVDFYLPEYSLMVDIETKMESRYYNEKKNEIRNLCLSCIKGMGYHIIKRKDLKSDDFRCKISGAMLSRWKFPKGKPRKKNKSLLDVNKS